MLQPFPQTEHFLLNALWEQQIRPLSEQMFAQHAIVQSHKPPNDDDIETWLAKSDEQDIVEALRDIDIYREYIKDLREWLFNEARTVLHSPANEDERKAARTKFNQLKNKLTASLHSLGHVASEEQENAIVDWVQTALTQVPKLNTTSANHDLKEMRSWLQSNHPEANIKSRGTIPLEWKKVYYNRSTGE